MRRLMAHVEGIEIVGKAKNGNEVLKILHEEDADLVVLDIEMPELNGIETTKIIRTQFPDIKILILSIYNEFGFIRKLTKAGVQGYVLKNREEEELVTAIEAVYNGKAYFDSAVEKTIREAIRRKDLNDYEIKITEREIEVVKLIAKGYSTKQIAEELYIAPYTVTSHRKNLMEKTGTSNASQLTVFAIKAGFIQITDL